MKTHLEQKKRAQLVKKYEHVLRIGQNTKSCRGLSQLGKKSTSTAKRKIVNREPIIFMFRRAKNEGPIFSCPIEQ